jgi:hypothetical protein
MSLALAITIAGVALLYASWRRLARDQRFVVPAAWLLLGFGASLWIRISGAEFGLAYSFIAMAFAAWSFVAVGRETRRSTGRRAQPRFPGARANRAEIRRIVARAFVAVPLAGAASVLVSVVCVAGLPWGTANRYVFAILVAPIIWAVAAAWVGMTANLSRAALVLAGVSMASSALLFVR